MKPNKITLAAGAVALLLLGALLILFQNQNLPGQKTDFEKREEAFREAGYSFAEAEKLAREGRPPSIYPQDQEDLPVTLRLPPGTPSPEEKISRLLLQSPEEICQEVESNNCLQQVSRPEQLVVWSRVDSIYLERDDLVGLASWLCLRKPSGEFVIEGPLFSKMILDGSEWKIKNILGKEVPDISGPEQQLINDSRQQLSETCLKR